MSSSRKATKIILITGVVICCISLLIILFYDLPKKNLAGKGSPIKEGEEESNIGGEFTLKDFNNNVFHSSSLEGNLSLLYFGFTYCPDICPNSLDKLVSVTDTLANYGIHPTVVFVTIDPKRDTPEVLREYLGNFNINFLGLTETQDKIDEVAKMFKVYYSKIQEATSEEGEVDYMMDHTAFIYLLNKKGKYVKHFYYDTSAEEIVEHILLNK